MATREEIYLAALLHDIGKFWQRADEGGVNKNDFQKSRIIDQHVLKNIGELSNITQDGFVLHAHAAYTQQFFENFSNVFNKFSSKDIDDNLTNLAIYHHKPKTFYQQLIQLADWWSSGIDRNKSYEKNENFDKDYRKRALNSIFENILVFQKNQFNNVTHSENNANYINLNPLNLTKEYIFPTADNKVTPQAYQEHWNKFIKEFDNLKDIQDFDVFADTLFYLLQKYLWCIPASTLKNEIHDSNLFEHCKTTAALVLCLFDYVTEKQIKNIDDINNTHRPVLLVSIDISGIQSFIYNISMKGAAKALKGRSFYLQLLMDTIINELLYDLKFYRSNVLYSSGGKAYLLLPNITKVTDYLKQYQEKVEKWLYDKFNGSVFVSFGFISFYFDRKKNDAEGDRGKKYLIDQNSEYYFVGDLWKAALDKANINKNQRFKSLLLDEDFKFFEPFGHGGDIQTCELTGEEIDKSYNIDDHCFSQSVGEQIELGKTLKELKYLVWKKDEDKHIKQYSSFRLNNENTSLNILDSYWYFFNDENKPSSVDGAIIYKTDLSDFNFLSSIAGKSVRTFKFYAGTTDIKEFSDLLDKESEFKRLAVFVMDVDNLGKIFVDGFKEKYCFWQNILSKKYETWLKSKNLKETIILDTKEYIESKDLQNDFHKYINERKINILFDSDSIDELEEEILNAANKLVDNLEKILDNFIQRYKKADELLENLNQKIYEDYSVIIKDNSSFSRLTTLSFYLDIFFSGYINTIKENYKDKLLIVYSGGDDLLALGEWQVVLEFVEDVRNNFYEFVCKRSEISFSGGISLFTDKFPVSKAISSAKEAEETAKKFKNSRKGALGLFNEVVSIRIDKDEDEWEKVKTIKDKLVNFSKCNLVNSAFIQRLQLFYLLKNRGEQNNDLKYRWTAAYYFKQYEKRINSDVAEKKDFEEFMKQLYSDLRLFLNQSQVDYFLSKRNFDLYAIAARWAELELRSQTVKI